MGTTRSTFLVVEDDISIGLFASRSIRVSIKETPELHNFENDKNRSSCINELSPPMQTLTDTTSEVTVVQNFHHHLQADEVLDNHSTEDIIQSISAQETKVKKHQSRLRN